MKLKRTYNLLIQGIVLLPAILFLTGCAAKKPLAESPETGLTLSYKLPPETGLCYVMKSDIVQSADFLGQTINGDIRQVLTFN